MTGALRIFAAGSLRPAFERLGAESADELQITYANARDLARRITAGESADVFASASEEHPRLLHDAGFVEAARPFATNRVVVAVPEASPAHDASVLAAAGSRLVIEVAGVPLGDYTREVFARLERTAGAGFAERALANVVIEEQLVDDVAARLLAGDADAAVLYATDVAARSPRLRAIELPAGVEVAVTYFACVTTSTPDRTRATAWVEGLALSPTLAIMRGAGFGPAP
ncbi:MAG: molybdate ABC transporter substrate-binding protein [Actinomycetota bacterium]|nr:molybdate ABC transporter substrate-binding protein [Actinomycetota bacterium]